MKNEKYFSDCDKKKILELIKRIEKCTNLRVFQSIVRNVLYAFFCNPKKQNQSMCIQSFVPSSNFLISK